MCSDHEVAAAESWAQGPSGGRELKALGEQLKTSHRSCWNNCGVQWSRRGSWFPDLPAHLLPTPNAGGDRATWEGVGVRVGVVWVGRPLPEVCAQRGGGQGQAKSSCEKCEAFDDSTCLAMLITEMRWCFEI